MHFDLADIRPSVYNWLEVTFLAIIGIVFFKWLTAKIYLPGLTELVHAV
jgi:hypothetical protein